MADLHFTYRDGPTRLCCELDDLKEDEITVVLEALKQRFDTVEQGAFSFSIKQEEDYSQLEWALRQRPHGVWMDSGIEDKALQLLIAFKPELDCDFNDDQQRWLDVRHTAQGFTRELKQLRGQLCEKPSSILIKHSPQESILEHVPHDKLLEHLAKIDPVVKRKKGGQEAVEAVLVEREKIPTDTQAEKGHDELLEHLAKIDPVAKRQQGGQEAVEEEAPGGGENDPDAVESAENGDEKAPYMPATWFADEFGIPASRLRAAKRSERLAAKDISRDGNRPSYRYSVPDAMKLWPADGIYLPDAGDEPKK